MEKTGELEGYWRGYVVAWRASGETQRQYCDRHSLKRHSLSYWQLRLARREAPAKGRAPLTLVVAAMVPEAVAPTPGLSLVSPSGWRLDFAALPPAGWVAELWGAGA